MGLTQILEQPYQNPKFPSEAFFEGLLWRVISPSTQIIWWPITYSWKALWVSYLTQFVSPHSEFGRRSYAHFRKICPAGNAFSSERFYCSPASFFFLSVGPFFSKGLYYFLDTIIQFPSLKKHFPLSKTLSKPQGSSRWKMELGWMVAIDFFTNFVWFLKIKVWGSFILDHSFFQGAQSKGFQGFSNTQKNPISILAWVLA